MQLFSFSSSPCSSSNSSPGNEQSDRGDTRFPIYLNVYDISPINKCLHWLGLGAYHSAIEAHGMEFGFGGHPYSFSGVFVVEPKKCPGFVFRRSILLGLTGVSSSEFWSFMRDLAAEYHGNTYHLISKNCNHFTNKACMHLTGNPIPGWVNRLAKVGSFCNCLVPGMIQVSPVLPVGHIPDQSAYSDDDDDEDNSESYSASSVSECDEPNQRLFTGSTAAMTIVRERRVRPTESFSYENSSAFI